MTEAQIIITHRAAYALSTDTVLVDGQSTYRNGTYYEKELSWNNASTAIWDDVPISVNGSTAETRYAFLADTPEPYTYDSDGNLTADGRWTYTWDAENRLTQVEAISSVPSGAKRKLQFAYDHMGRRVEKKVFDWNGSSYNASPSLHIKFANDGWRPVAELNGSTGAVIRSYCWGKDLSGSLEGAGGIGGLLMVQEGGATYAARYDANGNLVGFYNLTDDNIALRVEYGPYGQLLTSRGYYTSCPFRFSTKYQDGETGLYYFGYRYYDAKAGRWVSRDPIAEEGGVHLYDYVRGDCLSYVDPVGLALVIGAQPAPIPRPIIPPPTYPRLGPQLPLPEPIPAPTPQPLPPPGIVQIPPPAPPVIIPPPSVQPSPPPGVQPSPRPQPVKPETKDKCPCKIERIPPKGGNREHDRLVRFLQGTDQGYRVVAPDGTRCQFDGMMGGEFFEAKTGHRWLTRDWNQILSDDFSPKQSQLARILEEVIRCQHVAKMCGRNYVLYFDNETARDAWNRNGGDPPGRTPFFYR